MIYCRLSGTKDDEGWNVSRQKTSKNSNVLHATWEDDQLEQLCLNHNPRLESWMYSVTQTMLETWERENPDLEWQSCGERTWSSTGARCQAPQHWEQWRVGILRDDQVITHDWVAESTMWVKNWKHETDRYFETWLKFECRCSLFQRFGGVTYWNCEISFMHFRTHSCAQQETHQLRLFRLKIECVCHKSASSDEEASVCVCAWPSCCFFQPVRGRSGRGKVRIRRMPKTTSNECILEIRTTERTEPESMTGLNFNLYGRRYWCNHRGQWQWQWHTKRSPTSVNEGLALQARVKVSWPR